MEKLMIVNGSPRAPRSNSKRYGALVREAWGPGTETYLVTEKKHEEACRKLASFDHLLFAFPLYADGLPVTLMGFLKALEKTPPAKKPTVHILVNCGFYEPEQNRTACGMIQLFCRRNGYPLGSVLCVGSGEAILDTPFASLVKRKIGKLVSSIKKGEPISLKVTMPLPKRVYIRASTRYWLKYGEKNHLTRAQMETMDIETPNNHY